MHFTVPGRVVWILASDYGAVLVLELARTVDSVVLEIVRPKSISC